jgi:hypothetical protein
MLFHLNTRIIDTASSNYSGFAGLLFVAYTLASRRTCVPDRTISLVAPFIPLPLLHLPDFFPRDVEKSRSLPRRIGNESIPAPIFCALAWPLNPFFHEESMCSRAWRAEELLYTRKYKVARRISARRPLPVDRSGANATQSQITRARINR